MSHRPCKSFCLSVAALLLTALVAGAQIQPVEKTKVVVTTTNDKGAGSLREVLQQHGAKGMVTITFALPKDDPSFENGVFTIVAKTPLPALQGEQITLDAASQVKVTGDTNNGGPVVVLRNGMERKPNQDYPGVGLALLGKQCIVKGLVIQGFGIGVLFSGKESAENKVAGCYIGADAPGRAFTEDTMNTKGVRFQGGANENILGGLLAAERNVIAGNTIEINIHGADTQANIVQGNYIGLGAGGKTTVSQGIGVYIDGAARNIVGGNSEQARNVIAGNNYSEIYFIGAATENIVAGNYIGTDKDGAAAIGKAEMGVFFTGKPSGNIIGGAQAGAGNVIAAHKNAAIYSSFATGHVIQGNIIGLDAEGQKPLGAGQNAIFLYDGSDCIIGGDTPEARNVIAGNMVTGVAIVSEGGRPEPPHNNIVRGNYIGTDKTGTTPVGTIRSGVNISGGGRKNVIGIGIDGEGTGNLFGFATGDAAAEWPAGVRIRGNDPDKIRENTVRGNTFLGSGGRGAGLGPNGLQVNPVVKKVITDGGRLQITGSLHGEPNLKYLVDAYGFTTVDADKKVQRETYLGTATVTTSDTGNAAFTIKPTGKFEVERVAAAATDATGGASGEYGDAEKVVAGTIETATTATGATTTGGTANTSGTANTGGTGNTPAAPSGTPPTIGANEIRLDGKIKALDFTQRALTMEVTSFTGSNGKTAKLAAPKPKTVRLTGDALIVRHGAWAAPLAIDALQTGSILGVIGQDGGSGKELAARVVILAPLK